MSRRVVVVVSAVLALAVMLPGTSGATTHPRIRPHQYFSGLVNGSTGHPTPAIIKMVCPGPSNSTGHPLEGQTVEVSRAAATISSAGYTGNRGTSVSVFFGVLPPSGSAIGQVTFARYGVPKPIPTSVTLPCSGSGVVGFLPFPRTPPVSRAATVQVEYANIAAAGVR
jgi:hypothetical protein